MTLPQNVQTVIIPANVTYAGRQNNNKGGNITKLILNKNDKGTMYEIPAQQTKLKELVIPDEFSSKSFSLDYCTALKKLYVGSGMVQGSFGLCRDVILDELYISSLKNYLQMPTMEQTRFHSIYIGKPDEIIENKGAYGNVVVDYSWDRLEQERVLVTAEMVSEALKEVTVIKTSAFNGCYTLEGELVIPNTVLEIGTYVFVNCKGLTSLTIKEGVTSIGSFAFSGCSNLRGDLVIPNTVTNMGESAFAGCYIVSGVKGQKLYIEDITKINWDNTYHRAIFNNCNFEEIHINDINYLFHYQASFISNSVPDISIRRKFYINGELVENVVIEYSGNNIFNDSLSVSALRSVKINEGFTQFSGFTFERCTSLKHLDIPSTISALGTPFRNCNIDTLICRAVTPPTVNMTSASFTNIYVPDASVGAYQTASGWSAFASKIEPLSKYVES